MKSLIPVSLAFAALLALAGCDETQTEGERVRLFEFEPAAIAEIEAFFPNEPDQELLRTLSAGPLMPGAGSVALIARPDLGGAGEWAVLRWNTQAGCTGTGQCSTTIYRRTDGAWHWVLDVMADGLAYIDGTGSVPPPILSYTRTGSGIFRWSDDRPDFRGVQGWWPSEDAPAALVSQYEELTKE